MSISIPETDQNAWDASAEEIAAAGPDSGKALRIIVPVIAALLVSVIYLSLFNLSRQGPVPGNLFARIGYLLKTVLIPLLPFVILAIVFNSIFRMAKPFFNDIYQPPASLDLIEIISRRLFGLPNRVVIRDEKLDSNHDWIQWVGGPATLVIYDGFAVYIERGNLFSRVSGPGKIYLDWTETVKAIVDLRPIVKPGVVKAWTKDGIKIQMNVRMECQIGLDEKTPERPAKLVYPYNPVAVKKAVERTAVRYDQEKKSLVELKWVDAVWGRAQGFMSSYISSHTVDELFLAEWGSSQIMSREASIKMLHELNKGLSDYGAHILNLQITNIAIPDEVKDQRLEIWEAGRKSIATVNDGQAKAYEIRSREKARAEAEQDIIAAIAEGLERIEPDRLQESLLLSLSGILDQSLSDPVIRTLITNETLDTLEKLKNLLA